MIFIRTFLAASLHLGLAALSATAEPSVYNRHRDHVLGTSLNLVVVAGTEAEADRAEAAVLGEIERLSAILSTYDPGSEVSKLNAASKVKVSPDLVRVLTSCESFRQSSGNAMSCRIGKALTIWDKAEKQGKVPDRADLRLVSGQAGRADVAIDPASGSVTRPEAVQFRIDALAKGYIIDKALRAGRDAAPGADGLLLNIGGDQLAWGRGPHNGKWRTGISTFSADAAGIGVPVLAYSAGALATSGPGPRDRVIDGQHFGHIVSPADGWPVSGKQRASVYARDAMTADALATALMVMDISDGIALAEGLKGVEALIRADDGRTYQTSGWQALQEPAAKLAAAKAPPWPKGYSLAVDLEIPDLRVAKYERPYVAAWIADTDGKLVRILMLAGDEPRWMEENYYWFRRFGRKAGSLVDAMSGPTRRPGRYTLVWDGLDHDGNAAGPGTHILHVEAAREHGEHQHESIELEFGTGAFTKAAEPGAELGRIAVRFGAQP